MPVNYMQFFLFLYTAELYFNTFVLGGPFFFCHPVYKYDCKQSADIKITKIVLKSYEFDL